MKPLNVQGRAQRGAIVAGSGLNEHAVEEIAAFNEAIAGAIQSDAPRQAEVFQAGLAAKMAEDVELAGLQYGLQRGGEILV